MRLGVWEAVVTWPESTTGRSHDSGGCVRLGGCYMARKHDRKVA